MTRSKSDSVLAAEPVRVMVVDDSAVIRGFLTRFIETDPALKVMGSASNGQVALRKMEQSTFDVIVLDIEMPVMDGLTALPLILEIDPHIQIIIASTLTKENASITLKAFQIGAAECLAKPSSQELSGSNVFRDDLVEKVKTLGLLAKKKRRSAGIADISTKDRVRVARPLPVVDKSFSLVKNIVKSKPDVIAVGSSTGGPQALMKFFTDLKGGVNQPIFVTQHMPPTFTTILAEHISKQSNLNCKEAVDGEVVENSRVYLAPGGFHMLVQEKEGKKVIKLSNDPPENFCRPAVDPMMRSLVKIYGKKILAVILTGMGSDGLKGCKELVDVGGTVLAQDEATSVVWGMPGAVAMAGICSNVLPLGLMAEELKTYAGFGGLK